MSLLEKIKKEMGELPEKPVFSFVGAGGKTTCVLKLADELAGLGMKVLVTTSTHIQHPFYLGRTGLLDADTKTIKEAGVPGKVVIAGRKLEQEKKIAGLLETQLEEVLESYDAVIIEADGAKHYPFKVPAEHEPVIYQITTHDLIVESIQAFNRPLSEVCFRLERAQEILNQADCREKQLTPEIVAKLLEKGYLEKLSGSLSNPKRKIGVIFNQQDSQTFEEKLSVPVIYEKKLTMPEKKKLYLIMLASGFSRRFGGNKLIYSIEETPISPALSAASKLLDNICAQYPADTSRLYITGVSMGGYGAWDLLLRHPDLFAGAIILCGAGDPSQAAAIAHIPLRLFHGAKDTEVPVSGSREMYQALLDAGANDVQYQEYPDIGHWIWLNAWDEPGLLDWLFSVSK